MLKLNKQEIINRLMQNKALGLNEMQIDEIMTELNSIPLICELKEGIIEIGDKCKITFDGKRAGGYILTSSFKLEMNGLDSKRIRSVEIPKLDYADKEFLTLNIEYYPFDIPDYSFDKF